MRQGKEFKGRQFTAEVILWAVRWYLMFPISYRDLELMLQDRGVTVDHTTLFRWIQAYAPELEKRIRPHLRTCNGSWRVDETSYEDCCVKSVLFSAGPHRPFLRVLAFPRCRGGALRGEGVPSPTSYPAGQRPRHDPMFGSEELRGERRHSTSAGVCCT